MDTSDKIMKVISVIFVFLACSSISHAQTSSIIKKEFELKGVGDTYVVDLVINKKLFTEKCDCFASEKGTCDLYQGVIKRVYFVGGVNAPFDSVFLYKLKYFSVETAREFVVGNSYIVTLTPTVTNQYMRINNVLKLDNPDVYHFYNSVGYLSKSKCYEVGFFNTMFLKLGLIKPEAIDYSNKRLKKDMFDDRVKTLSLE